MDYASQFLGKIVTVTVDRPLGTKHPTHNYYYPVNYGYIAGVKAPDKDDLDAYVIGVFKPVKTFEGRCLAVIHRTDGDIEDKLIVAPKNNTYSDEQIKALVEFQERFFHYEILRSHRVIP